MVVQALHFTPSATQAKTRSPHSHQSHRNQPRPRLQQRPYHVDVFDPNEPVDITPFAVDSFILTPTPSAVPEPTPWLLLGTGICLRSRNSQAAPASSLIPIPALHRTPNSRLLSGSRLLFIAPCPLYGFSVPTAAAVDSESPKSASAPREPSAPSTPESPESVARPPSPRSEC
jgi:hypothetical protein